MDNLPTSQAENHAFNTVFASIYGVHEAILISHFQSWINHNKRLGRNFIDGRTWCYQTRKEIAAWFPYFSEKQVRKITDKLEKLGVLRKGNYNKSKFDKTIWYSFENEEIFTIAQMGNGDDQMGNGDDQMGKPIPYSKPYSKPFSKKHICPTGENALFSFEKDEMGHEEYKPKIVGSLKSKYESLSDEQKHSFKLLINVPPTSDTDQRINVVTAAEIASKYNLEQIRKAILFYKQKIDEGLKIRNTGALLVKFINDTLEPMGKDSNVNKKFWNQNKHLLPKGSYKESKRYIFIQDFYIELHFNMNNEIFKQNFKKLLELYKDE